MQTLKSASAFAIVLACLLLGASLSAAYAVTPAERQALIALYNSTNGDSWTNNTGWKTPPLDADGFAMPGTEGTWHGVTVDSVTLNVTLLSLVENNLVGILPPELGNLTNLLGLSLRTNQLSGTIPAELGNLTSLQSLSLYSNQLSGLIPPELGNLASLINLYLYSNQLSGAIPPGLGNLTHIQNIRLDDNQLSGSIPPQLGNLTNLLSLSLDSNQLSGAIPPELGYLSNLRGLSLHSNQLSGAIPPELGNLAGLYNLYLHSNQLSGPIPPELGNLRSLYALYLYSNQLSGAIPPELGNLTSLSDLLLDFNQLSGPIPPELGNLTALSYLCLSFNQLSGSIPPELENLAGLGVLDLGVNQLSGVIPAWLGNLTSLHWLYLDDNQLSGVIPPELGNLTNLFCLSLEYNQLSGPIPSDLGNMTSLLYLYLGSNLLSGTIPPELGNLTSLSRLSVSRNQLSGPIPPELGNLTSLSRLYINANRLSGPIPVSLANLANLIPPYLNLGYNALYATDEALIIFLNSKDSDWALTQTIAPADVAAIGIGASTVQVSWMPIAYTADPGGYRVFWSETAGGPYAFAGQTADKSAVSLAVTGLMPATPYYFVVQTRTEAHANNQNIVDSENSEEASGATLAQALIRGTILDGGVPLANVMMAGLPGNPVTDPSGLYQGLVDIGWSGTVTPTLSGYVFTPEHRTYPGISLDLMNEDYLATLVVTNQPPATPSAISPVGGVTGISIAPLLRASVFSDPDWDWHAFSQWQVDNSADFSSPEWDSGETWKPGVLTQVPAGALAVETPYFWRVRYQDNRGAWSEWSSRVDFVTAPADPRWSPVVAAIKPGARMHHATAYDASRHQLVLFGGYHETLGYLDDTWIWDGASWTQVFPAHKPSPREDMAMAFDSARQVVVLYGGYYGEGVLFEDTWIWDGTDWAQVFPAHSPGTRSGHMMVYDAGQEEIFLHGGLTAAGPEVLGDSWTWDGNDWSIVAPAVSLPRYDHGLAYDQERGEIVLFGGRLSAEGADTDETWIWNGSAWTQKFPLQKPAPREALGLFYDAVARETVMFGGFDRLLNSPYADTWVWNGQNWLQATQGNCPSPRSAFSLSFNSDDGQAILFGGGLVSDYTWIAAEDTWLYTGVAPEFVKEDLLATWDGQGVYYRNSDTGAFVKLASPATMIAAGDLDGDGIDDLIGLWPGQGGIWVKYSSTGAWAKLSLTAVHIAAGDMNGDGRVDLLGTWDGQGVYYRNSISGAWIKLASPATIITTGDIDGDNTDDLVGIWPSQGGVWVKYSSSGQWAKLSSTARDIAVGDMNGDGRDDLLATWDGQGVYYRNSVSGAWVKMASQADQVTSGDLDADGTDDLIGIWPTQGGVWAKYSTTGAWARLSSTARDISAGVMRAQGTAGASATDTPEGATMMAGQAFEQLPLPVGGTEEGPGTALTKRDLSDLGPGGARFIFIDEINFNPVEDPAAALKRIPGPGEPGFVAEEQKNIFPGEVMKERNSRDSVKTKKK